MTEVEERRSIVSRMFDRLEINTERYGVWRIGPIRPNDNDLPNQFRIEAHRDNSDERVLFVLNLDMRLPNDQLERHFELILQDVRELFEAGAYPKKGDPPMPL